MNTKIITDGARLFLQEFFFIDWTVYFKLNNFNLYNLNFSTYSEFQEFRKELYNQVDEKIIILNREGLDLLKKDFLINIKYGIVDFYLNLLGITDEIDNKFNKKFTYEIKGKEIFLEQTKKILNYFLSERWFNQDNYQYYHKFLETKIIIYADFNIKELVLKEIKEGQKYNKFLFIGTKLNCIENDKNVII